MARVETRDSHTRSTPLTHTLGPGTEQQKDKAGLQDRLLSQNRWNCLLSWPSSRSAPPPPSHVWGKQAAKSALTTGRHEPAAMLHGKMPKAW